MLAIALLRAAKKAYTSDRILDEGRAISGLLLSQPRTSVATVMKGSWGWCAIA